MQDDIRDAIDQLNTAFLEAETDGVISDDERSELRALVGSLDNLLAAPESHEGVVEQVEGFALAFQSVIPASPGLPVALWIPSAATGSSSDRIP